MRFCGPGHLCGAWSPRGTFASAGKAPTGYVCVAARVPRVLPAPSGTPPCGRGPSSLGPGQPRPSGCVPRGCPEGHAPRSRFPPRSGPALAWPLARCWWACLGWPRICFLGVAFSRRSLAPCVSWGDGRAGPSLPVHSVAAVPSAAPSPAAPRVSCSWGVSQARARCWVSVVACDPRELGGWAWARASGGAQQMAPRLGSWARGPNAREAREQRCCGRPAGSSEQPRRAGS